MRTPWPRFNEHNFARSVKQIDEAIADALERADAAGISGKEATPFLLDAISKITQGKSLATSILFLKKKEKTKKSIKPFQISSERHKNKIS